MPHVAMMGGRLEGEKTKSELVSEGIGPKKKKKTVSGHVSRWCSLLMYDQQSQLEIEDRRVRAMSPLQQR